MVEMEEGTERHKEMEWFVKGTQLVRAGNTTPVSWFQFRIILDLHFCPLDYAVSKMVTVLWSMFDLHMLEKESVPWLEP